MTGPNDGVGVFGTLCEARKERVFEKMTRAGKRWLPAVCNRWTQHDGPHRQVDGKTFTTLHEWNDDTKGKK